MKLNDFDDWLRQPATPCEVIGHVVHSGTGTCPLETRDTVAAIRALDGTQSTAHFAAETTSRSATTPAAPGLGKPCKSLAGRWRR